MAEDAESKFDFVVEVEGQGRVIRGVSVDTTCGDLVKVLSNATKKTKPQVMVEIWHNCMRRMSPEERPLLVWAQWGKHKKQVTFALKDADFFVSQPSHKKPKGYLIKHKALRRSELLLGRMKRSLRKRLQGVTMIASNLDCAISSLSEDPEKLKLLNDHKDELLKIFKEKESLLKRHQKELAQLEAKLQSSLGNSTLPKARARERQLMDVISCLDQELTLRTNLHQLQSTKVLNRIN